jgi:dTDP-4-amino-4,6-dideoxygalactose transaminase
MEEFNAILASASMRGLNDNIAARAAISAQYTEELQDVPGLAFQHVPEENISSYKDFAILVDEQLFGLSRDQLQSALTAERIMTKTYFSPPVHRQKAYKRYAPKNPRALATTDYVSSRVLCLPIYAHMKPATVSRICAAIRAIHDHAAEIRRSWQAGRAARRSKAAELTVGASMP